MVENIVMLHQNSAEELLPLQRGSLLKAVFKLARSSVPRQITVQLLSVGQFPSSLSIYTQILVKQGTTPPFWQTYLYLKVNSRNFTQSELRRMTTMHRNGFPQSLGYNKFTQVFSTKLPT